MIKRKIMGVICAGVAAALLFSAASASACENKDTAKGSYSIKVTGYDWGPGVNKAVITLDKKVHDVSNDLFNVVEVKNSGNGVQESQRTVTNVYLSDAKGNKRSGESKNITIELSVSNSEGSPFLYNSATSRNEWTSPYYLKISLAEGKSLKTRDKEITKVDIKQKFVTKSLGVVDKFKEKTYKKDGDISMKYSYFKPAKDNKKNPLIIWLHGLGEGGNDTTIPSLAAKVGALAEGNIQSKFGGAYVLVPQCPTMWMDTTGNNDKTTDGNSMYTSSLLHLIKSYVDSNDDIDTSKIYVGGCSNGGYMTMALLLEDPDYFAAAYPICEGYESKWISDEEMASLEYTPIWFTYAKNDARVNPLETAVPIMGRLRDMGNDEVHASVFDKVVDTSGLCKDEKGNPYEYPGHFSWTYVFNDQCKDGDESLWDWMAAQSKVSGNELHCGGNLIWGSTSY